MDNDFNAVGNKSKEKKNGATDKKNNRVYDKMDGEKCDWMKNY